MCNEKLSWISSKKLKNKIGMLEFGAYTMLSCDAVICGSPDFLAGIDACNIDPKYFKGPEHLDNLKNGKGRLTSSSQKGHTYSHVWVTSAIIILKIEAYVKVDF